MKPPPFEYFAPASIKETLDLLREHGDEAKLLAGGQSLVPMLNFRLVRPAALVDLNGVSGLDGIREEDGMLRIGAMTRQRAVERSAVVRDKCPLLAEAMPQIGHAQIRNRGTVGGSLVHADPAAEIPAVVAALGGELIVRGAERERTVAARDFFVGYLTTAVAADELLVAVRVPTARPRSGHAFLEVSRRHGDFALVGVAASVTLDGSGVCTAASLALTGVGPTPVVPADVIGALVGQRPGAAVFEEVARRVSAGLEPHSDLHASSDYRKHVGGVLARRALALATERAGAAR